MDELQIEEEAAMRRHGLYSSLLVFENEYKPVSGDDLSGRTKEERREMGFSPNRESDEATLDLLSKN